MKQNKDREEFEKKIEDFEDWYDDAESVDGRDKNRDILWNYFQSYTQKKVEEVKCQDCSLEDKHICPDDRSTTRISRHCAGEDIQTIAGTLLKSKEWKEWYKYASKNMLFDVDETETVDMMSDGHFNSFIKFTKSKVRTELLEEIKKQIRDLQEEPTRAGIINLIEKL